MTPAGAGWIEVGLNATLWRFMRWIDDLRSPYTDKFMAEMNAKRRGGNR